MALPPPTLNYEEGDPIPPGYEVRTRANRAMLITGGVLFGAPYLVSSLIAATIVSADSRSGGDFAPLFIPAIGPFITIGTSSAEGAGTFWLVLDGLTQAAGITTFIVGLTRKDHYLLRTTYPTASIKPEVLVGPASASLKWHF